MNNPPAVLVALPCWEFIGTRRAVLLGAIVGSTLWVTGALSTLLWQSTMARLGLPLTYS